MGVFFLLFPFLFFSVLFLFLQILPFHVSGFRLNLSQTPVELVFFCPAGLLISSMVFFLLEGMQLL